MTSGKIDKDKEESSLVEKEENIYLENHPKTVFEEVDPNVYEEVLDGEIFNDFLDKMAEEELEKQRKKN